jgi:hypothetical protein
MPMRSRVAFGPEAIAEMSEMLDAAFKKPVPRLRCCANSSTRELLRRQGLGSVTRLAC